jgi:hypothetical protein
MVFFRGLVVFVSRPAPRQRKEEELWNGETYETLSGRSRPATCLRPTSSSRIMPTNPSHRFHSSSVPSPSPSTSRLTNSSFTCLNALTIFVSVLGDGVKPREMTRDRSRMREAVVVSRDEADGGIAVCAWMGRGLIVWREEEWICTYMGMKADDASPDRRKSRYSRNIRREHEATCNLYNATILLSIHYARRSAAMSVLPPPLAPPCRLFTITQFECSPSNGRVTCWPLERLFRQ